MIKQIKNNWLILLLAMMLTVAGNMFLSSWNYGREVERGAASVDYVDKENTEQSVFMKSVNDRQDADLRELHSTKADKTEVNSIHQDVREIRDTQLKIYEILIKDK